MFFLRAPLYNLRGPFVCLRIYRRAIPGPLVFIYLALMEAGHGLHPQQRKKSSRRVGEKELTRVSHRSRALNLASIKETRSHLNGKVCFSHNQMMTWMGVKGT